MKATYEQIKICSLELPPVVSLEGCARLDEEATPVDSRTPAPATRVQSLCIQLGIEGYFFKVTEKKITNCV